MTLDHLDMAIAFAVVMLTVSMLVTIFVQTASTVLGLRGTNLRWGIDQLLRMVHPELGDRAGALTDRVLRHPIISDSSMSRFAKARNIPVIGRWIGRLHYASAIRVDELVGIMDVLAGSTPAPARLSDATTDAERMAYVVAAARRRLVPVNAIADEAAAVRAQLAAAGVSGAQQVDVALGNASSQLKLAKDDLEAWFDVTMDRVTERFVVHVRLWTIVFSILVAFALHLDSFRLLSQLASNSEARARLAGASDAIQRAAVGTLGPQPLAAAAQASAASSQPSDAQPAADALPAPPVMYQAVMKRLLATDPALEQIDAATLPGFFPDRVAASGWLRGALVSVGSSPVDIESAVAKYETAVDDALSRNLSGHEADVRRLSDQALTMRGILEGTGFQLVPNPYHAWDMSPWWPRPVWAGVSFTTLGNLFGNLFFVRPSNLHFWGILFSAGLLSLGAPFWYNALKGLSALKPTVASKAQHERQGQ